MAARRRSDRTYTRPAETWAFFGPGGSLAPVASSDDGVLQRAPTGLHSPHLREAADSAAPSEISSHRPLHRCPAPDCYTSSEGVAALMADHHKSRRSAPTGAAAPVADVGCWFLVPEAEIRLLNGRRRGPAFAAKAGHRPVVLARLPDVSEDAVFFPRSTRRGTGRGKRRFHERHRHHSTHRQCRITRDGWVILDAPATVAPYVLTQVAFSCREPGGTGLVEAMIEAL